MLIYEEYISTVKEEESQELDKMSTGFWRELAIAAIIDFEINSKLQCSCKMETRSSIKKKKKLKLECELMRGKQIASELYLKIHIADDISRSIAELNFAIEQLG